jgi:hypothetical protein
LINAEIATRKWVWGDLEEEADKDTTHD